MPLSRTSLFSILIAASLLLVTLGVYRPALEHDFVDFDDTGYVLENRAIQRGIDTATIEWAFTSDRMGTWHPLTWLSHAADWSAYGSNAGGHHLTNLVLHVINALLLFGVLRRMTGSLWASAFVAFVFALHPLNVASVAWIASRKGLLSTTFWMLTMWSYLDYVRHGTRGRYALVLLALVLGLLSKPMVVTLPLILLLLDVWPLGRLQWNGRSIERARPLREKVPLFVAVTAVSIVVFSVRLSGDPLAWSDRLIQVPLGYVLYLRRIFWPSGLATPYPPWSGVTVPQVVAALVVLVGITVVAFRHRRDKPYLAVGWVWFLVTLAPVIGLVQVGGYVMADRWTYVPMIGVLIMVTWAVPPRLSEGGASRVALGVAGVAVVVALSLVTRAQVQYWRNSETLFERAIEVTDGNRTAHYNLAYYFSQNDRPDEAVMHYRRAIAISPDHFPSHHNLALLLIEEGRTEEAVGPTCAALRLSDPDDEALRETLTAHLHGAPCPE